MSFVNHFTLNQVHVSFTLGTKRGVPNAYFSLFSNCSRRNRAAASGPTHFSVCFHISDRPPYCIRREYKVTFDVFFVFFCFLFFLFLLFF